MIKLECSSSHLTLGLTLSSTLLNILLQKLIWLNLESRCVFLFFKKSLQKIEIIIRRSFQNIILYWILGFFFMDHGLTNAWKLTLQWKEHIFDSFYLKVGYEKVNIEKFRQIKVLNFSVELYLNVEIELVNLKLI